MRLDRDEARARLAAEIHGVLCTLNPGRGTDPEPVVYAVSQVGDDSYVGVPIDRVKPKTSTRLQREDNFDADPRGSLLIEHWDADDWSRLWWVRATLKYLPNPSPSLVDDLAERLARTVPQYAREPFHRVVVCRITSVTGWSAADA